MGKSGVGRIGLVSCSTVIEGHCLVTNCRGQNALPGGEPLGLWCDVILSNSYGQPNLCRLHLYVGDLLDNGSGLGSVDNRTPNLGRYFVHC